MKNILYKSLLIIFLFGIMSCSDFLEEEVLDQISVDYIYSTEEGLKVGVNALYNRMRQYNVPAGDAGAALRANLFFMTGTDLGMTRTYHRPYDRTNHTAVGFPSEKWIGGYQLIDRCNAIINSAANVDGEAKTINNVVAQARTIRAELYFDLIRMYDNILLDTTATTPENVDDPIVYAPANPADVFALIDGDLSFAIQNLAYNEPYGRYNKAVARHLKGKAAMWQKNYQEAANQFDAIITESGKKLVGINQVFGQNLNHSEMLFAYTFNEILGGSNDLAGGGGHWIGAVFTQRLYEQGSGDFIQQVEYGGQALAWSHPNNYLKSLYDKQNDRRYTAYYYPETYVANNPNSPRFGQVIPVSAYDNNFRRYNFSLKKFYDAEKGALTNDSWKDYPMYRLAETLLLGSEAHWRLGNEAKALEYINTVRRRAYGGSQAYDFTSYTLDTYLEESARELAMERNRWFLLKRLGLLVERQSKYYQYGSNSTNLVLEPMQPHMVTCPIPQSQIDLMGTFPQNPGY
ncbi:MAG: RagB/SusD family nutrient uptake outer membrane protein [Saprospiraceae bacterium]|nr:RagB/SusD family nutrient uptake outer membrane protein [Saprospiraceae bacterium]MBK8634051.1 RagB/SusD family nutrient uptake outer membrane protein [Saprospiraceae bacterium]MBP7642057.1 RagB/SusD family nutrient uptake outer membrane protein [Saprospiraceae bacterium]